ncbi:hypothetical protein [Nocardioides sp.]|uniref:hypothetical protein n=1 Tax=Nocardioides sp. TaxID=35761 RepID=UPI002ED8EC16
MRLSPGRRRAADEAPADAPPPPPGPPRGAPVAAYAGILDGHTLWLALEPVAGTIALRDADGEVHPLRSDVPEDDPAYRSVRADLLDLPGDAEGGYDVVVDRGSVRSSRTVWIPPGIAPFPRTRPRIPPAPGGRWQFALVRTEEGMLRVRRSRPAPALDVLDLAVDETGIRVRFEHTDATELRLVPPGPNRPDGPDGPDRPALATYPVTREDDHCVAVLTEPDLPAGTDQVAQVLAGGLRLRRRRNDLTNAQQAVLLPLLSGDDPDASPLRLRWSPDATLVARLVEGGGEREPDDRADDEPDDEADDGTDDGAEGSEVSR